MFDYDNIRFLEKERLRKMKPSAGLFFFSVTLLHKCRRMHRPGLGDKSCGCEIWGVVSVGACWDVLRALFIREPALHSLHSPI